jgi:hypothetical protein
VSCIGSFIFVIVEFRVLSKGSPVVVVLSTLQYGQIRYLHCVDDPFIRLSNAQQDANHDCEEQTITHFSLNM